MALASERTRSSRRTREEGEGGLTDERMLKGCLTAQALLLDTHLNRNGLGKT